MSSTYIMKFIIKLGLCFVIIILMMVLDAKWFSDVQRFANACITNLQCYHACLHSCVKPFVGRQDQIEIKI